MNSLAEAFCRARRHTRAEKRSITQKPKPKEEIPDYSELFDEAFLFDHHLSSDFNRDFPSSKQARPISLHHTPGRTAKRFAQTH